MRLALLLARIHLSDQTAVIKRLYASVSSHAPVPVCARSCRASNKPKVAPCLPFQMHLPERSTISV